MSPYRIWLSLLSLIGCGYTTTYTPAGTPNFHPFPEGWHYAPGNVPGMFRTGVPPTQAAWDELRKLVAPNGEKVTKVVLHDKAEGDESPAVAFGWNLVWVTLPPMENKPLTAFTKPPKKDVDHAVDEIVAAHERGDIVVWGCKEDRDRGGLISALVGMRMLGWSKDQAWDYALRTGLRWELPDLDVYWIEDVKAH